MWFSKPKPKIEKIKAIQVLDSRGMPTIRAYVYAAGQFASFDVPSGASTGTHEALELRDGDEKSYNGKSVFKNVATINNEIDLALFGLNLIDNQVKIDETLYRLDGTDNKSKIGANTMLAVSLACSRLASKLLGLPLYIYLSQLADTKFGLSVVPMFNMINGGAHATNNLDFQEYVVLPKADSISERIHIGFRIFQALKTKMVRENHRSGYGDEGGFSPDFGSNKEPFEWLLEAAAEAGMKQQDFALGFDAAASEFYDADKGKYKLKNERIALKSDEMIEYIHSIVSEFPIETIEDGLSEDDWAAWALLTKKFKKNVLIGDDLFTTNIERLDKGINSGVANAILIKPNQIGTLTETLDTIAFAKQSGYKVAISHRSGDTTDDYIADLAVAVDADYLKAGAPNRGERVAKYNRLLEIEQDFARNFHGREI